MKDCVEMLREMQRREDERVWWMTLASDPVWREKLDRLVRDYDDRWWMVRGPECGPVRLYTDF